MADTIETNFDFTANAHHMREKLQELEDQARTTLDQMRHAPR